MFCLGTKFSLWIIFFLFAFISSILQQCKEQLLEQFNFYGYCATRHKISCFYLFKLSLFLPAQRKEFYRFSFRFCTWGLPRFLKSEVHLQIQKQFQQKDVIITFRLKLHVDIVHNHICMFVVFYVLSTSTTNFFPDPAFMHNVL